MFGSAGNIMSIASGFSAMIEAMTTTNSGKPIGRWPEETQALALISDTYDLISGRELVLMLRCTMPNPGWQPIGQGWGCGVLV